MGRTCVHTSGIKEHIEPSEVVRYRRGWHRGQETASVTHRPESRIENREDAAVRAVANQPSEALKKREDRQWDLIFTKRVAAGGVDCFDPRGRDRIARGRERQLVDDHAAQSLADDVDALPEAGG